MWKAFMWRWMLVTFAGLTTFILYPAAPPWWAAQHGLIEHVDRISSRGWTAVGMHAAGNVLNNLQNVANPVAAVPSLHFAFALTIALFFAMRVRKRWIPLLALYPLAMAFTLSYSGEHHVADMIVAAVYVVAAFALVKLGEIGLARWRARRLAASLAVDTAAPELTASRSD